MPAPVQLGDEDYVKALMFGNPKQGKTTAAAGLARMGKVVAIDTEGQGWLKAPLTKRGIPTENIVKLPATSYEDMEDNYWKILAMFDDPEVTSPVGVVVDHMTDLESRLIRAETIRRVGKLSKPLREKMVKGGQAGEFAAAALKDLSPFVTEIQDYGVWTNQAKHIMRMYRDLPCHVVFVAHFRTEGGVRVPSLTEKFRVDLMGSMNMILACTKMKAGETEEYVAYTREMDGWYAGDRFDVLKPVIVNPSMDRIVASVRGDLDWDTDPAQQAFKQALQS
jgi:hypothetical protein